MTQLALFPDTLAEARATVTAALVPGAAACACPCCGQHVELYARKLRACWMEVLEDLAAHDERSHGAWKLLDNANATGAAAARDFGLLRFWSLLDRHPTEAGLYRITESGRAFLMGGALQPLTAYVFNNELRGFGPELVTYAQVARPAKRRAA